MPHLGPTAVAIWILAIVLQPALAGILVKRGIWKRWLSVFAFLCLKSIGSFVLLGIAVLERDPDQKAFWYFYTYWGISLVSGIVIIWVAMQLMCELLGCSRAARTRLRLSIAAAAVLSIAASLALSFEVPMAVHGRIVCIAVDLSKAVDLGLLLMFLAIIAVSEFAGILLDQTVIGILVGLVLNAAGRTLAFWLISISPAWPLSELQGIIYAAALIVWAVTFLRKQTAPDSVHMISGMMAALQSYRLVAERILRRS